MRPDADFTGSINRLDRLPCIPPEDSTLTENWPGLNFGSARPVLSRDAVRGELIIRTVQFVPIWDSALFASLVYNLRISVNIPLTSRVESMTTAYVRTGGFSCIS